MELSRLSRFSKYNNRPNSTCACCVAVRGRFHVGLSGSPKTMRKGLRLSCAGAVTAVNSNTPKSTAAHLDSKLFVRINCSRWNRQISRLAPAGEIFFSQCRTIPAAPFTAWRSEPRRRSLNWVQTAFFRLNTVISILDFISNHLPSHP